MSYEPLTQRSIDRALAQINFVDRKFDPEAISGNCLKLDDCTRDEFHRMCKVIHEKYTKDNMKLVITIQDNLIMFEHLEIQVYDYLELLMIRTDNHKTNFKGYTQMVDRLAKALIQ